MKRASGLGTYEQTRSLDEPAPTVQTHGRLHTRNELSIVYDDVAADATPAQATSSATGSSRRPPYRVPSMVEIAAVPWNGYTCASLFSGCGGSSLGYKMAGFKVLWANEFIPAAQEVYRLNHPDTLLDTRDIRDVQASDILHATGLAQGQLDLLDGSPPCASFSTAGRREQSWGQVKEYSDTRQRTDDLFFEYARLLRGLQPRTFVAENVSGLVKGVAKGYFKDILQSLKACGYNVKAQLLDAQWLGVPQMRQRIIFVGVRDDLQVEPAFPRPLPYRYSVRAALPWIEQVSNLLPGKRPGMQSSDRPCPTVTTGDTGGNSRHAIVAMRDDRGAFGNGGDITDQPAPTVLSGSVGTHWMVEATILDEPAVTVQAGAGARTSSAWSHGTCAHPTEKRKFSIAELKRICAFPDDFQLTGTYAQQWERLGRAVPPVMMWHIARTIRSQVLDVLSLPEPCKSIS